jgi:hypothetical protein
LYPNNSTTLAFNDITTGDNIIACTKGTTGCPSTAPFQYGFSAGTGYDQVTGLGSINGMSFAKAWDATRTSTTTTIQASASSANQGASVTFTATVSPATSGVVNFFNNGSSTPLGQATLSNGTAKFSTTSLPVGANSVTAGFAGNTKNGSSTSGAPAEVSVSTASFTLTPSVTTLTVAQGQTTGPEQIVVTSSDGFIVGTGSSAQTLMPVTYTCSGLPSEANCLFNAASSSGTGSITTSATSVTLTISTTAPTAKLLRLLNRGQSIFYAVLFPGLLGIVATIGSRKRSLGVFSILALIVLLSWSALWMSSCGGGSSTPKDPGTPSGNSNIVVNATTGGSNPITGSVKFTLTVTP